MPRTFIVFALALSALAGCATSPVNVTERSSFSKAAPLVLGTAGGALIGNKLNSKWGGAAGAVVGLGAGAIYNNLADKNAARIAAESYEQGKRDERVRVMKQYWQDKTTSLKPSSTSPSGGRSNSQGGAGRQVEYEEGTYEDINMLPHTDSVPVTSN